MSGEFKPVVVITGAAGGLGRALVSEFSHQGWDVAAVCHRKTLAGEPRAKMTARLDITDARQVSSGFLSILDALGRIDALVNNAGLAADNALPRLDEAQWDDVVDTNLKGPFLCARAVAPVMAAQAGGVIINIASFSGRVGSAGQVNYAAAKAGLFGLTASLAAELGSPPKGGIRVNAVLPGFLDTAMTRPLSPRLKRAAVEANVLKRLNTTAEAARFVAFLAGMRNVSGQIFQLDSRLAPWT
jgi:3-oxoacyl-[acyl-carrier protein] reductase